MLNFSLFILLCLSWGSTWIAIKVGVESVPPLFYAGTRFFAAGALILMVYGVVKGKRGLCVQSCDIKPLFFMSALVVSICFSLIFWGEKFVSASVTAIVVQGMIPIFLPFFAYLNGNEGLNITRLVSIVLGILGIICIFISGINEDFDAINGNILSNFHLIGLVAIIVGTLTYCYGSVWGKPLLSRNPAVAIAGWQNLLGGIIILIGSIVLEVPVYSKENFLAIFMNEVFFAWVWLVVVGSAIGFVLYIVLLKAWGPSKVSPYAFATPIVAIALDYMLFGHWINEIETIGLIIIFIALSFAFYKPRKKI